MTAPSEFVLERRLERQREKIKELRKQVGGLERDKTYLGTQLSHAHEAISVLRQGRENEIKAEMRLRS